MSGSKDSKFNVSAVSQKVKQPPRENQSEYKNVTVLLPSDVNKQSDNRVFKPNTMEMAEIHKPEKGQYAPRMKFTPEMTKLDVEKQLRDTFSILRDPKERFCCASAVNGGGRLEFYGNKQIWSGGDIKKRVKGNSALYILTEGTPEAIRSRQASTDLADQEMLPGAISASTTALTSSDLSVSNPISKQKRGAIDRKIADAAKHTQNCQNIAPGQGTLATSIVPFQFLQGLLQHCGPPGESICTPMQPLLHVVPASTCMAAEGGTSQKFLGCTLVADSCQPKTPASQVLQTEHGSLSTQATNRSAKHIYDESHFQLSAGKTQGNAALCAKTVPVNPSQQQAGCLPTGNVDISMGDSNNAICRSGGAISASTTALTNSDLSVCNPTSKQKRGAVKRKIDAATHTQQHCLPHVEQSIPKTATHVILQPADTTESSQNFQNIAPRQGTLATSTVPFASLQGLLPHCGPSGQSICTPMQPLSVPVSTCMAPEGGTLQKFRRCTKVADSCQPKPPASQVLQTEHGSLSTQATNRSAKHIYDESHFQLSTGKTQGNAALCAKTVPVNPSQQQAECLPTGNVDISMGDSNNAICQSDITVVEEMFPSSGPTEGGTRFIVNLSQVLPVGVTSVEAIFKDLGRVPLQIASNFASLIGISPRSETPGEVDVTIQSTDGWQGGKILKFEYTKKSPPVPNVLEQLLNELKKERSDLKQSFFNQISQGLGLGESGSQTSGSCRAVNTEHCFRNGVSSDKEVEKSDVNETYNPLNIFCGEEVQSCAKADVERKESRCQKQDVPNVEEQSATSVGSVAKMRDLNVIGRESKTCKCKADQNMFAGTSLENKTVQELSKDPAISWVTAIAKRHDVGTYGREPEKCDLETNEEGLLLYKMFCRPRGFCIIINNTSFVEELPDRVGSEIDERKTEALFRELDFCVSVLKNLTRSEILQTMDKSAAKDHTKSHAFVLVIMSHGDMGDVVYGVDGHHIKLEDLMNPLTAASCPTLKNKPKLFFIQACRGHATDLDQDKTNRFSTCPQEPDFLLSFATVPGLPSWRSPINGSCYIQILVEVIRSRHKRNHLLDMLTEVGRRVVDTHAQREGIKSRLKKFTAQTPSIVHTLRGAVFL